MNSIPKDATLVFVIGLLIIIIFAFFINVLTPIFYILESKYRKFRKKRNPNHQLKRWEF
jgi:hypothetical protein